MKRMIVLLFIACIVAFSSAIAGTPEKSPPNMIVLYMPVHNSVGQLWLDRTGQLHGVRLQLLKVLNRDMKPMGIQLS